MNASQAIHGLLSRALTQASPSQPVHVLGEALELSPATQGLLALAPARVHLLPAADASLVGLGVGLALSGARPVIELSGPDALWGILQQLGQEAAPLRAAGGEFSAPLVIRVPFAPNEALPLDLLAGLSGITVACAADADDLVAMLQAALLSPNPVVLLESRALLGAPVHDSHPSASEAPRPLHQARLLREGTDATVLSWGPAAAVAARAAADALANDGISTEILDLRCLSPLDEDAVGQSVRKTGRPLLVGCPERTLFAAVRAAFLRLESPPAAVPDDAPALTEAIRRAVHY